MTSAVRSVTIAFALASAAVGLAVGGATAAMSQAGTPCQTMGSVASWSPSGKRIAFVGYGLRSAALCVADADGSHARRLGHATCARLGYCRLINTPTELSWVRPKLLLYGDWATGIFVVPLAGKPKRIGTLSDIYDGFSVDAAGDRLAHGSSGCCTTSRGPVTVLGLPSGRVVGKIGGTTTANFSPSLSPDGKQVAFEGGRTGGVWTASVADGNLRRLSQCHSSPVWSPTGKWIACLGPPQAWPSGPALLLVSSQGDTSVTVTRPSLGVRKIFGWSPNGSSIAFSAQNSATDRLDVVNLATDKVRALLSPSGTNVAWSPDSQRLLAIHDCKLWEVPADARKKPRRLRTPPAGSQAPC
jgi:Tol biopolymer transport system component